jgi:hypothetical protein
MNRRSFLQATTLAAAGVTVTAPWQNLFSVEAGGQLNSFQSRRKWVLDAVVADSLKHKELYWVAQACFVRGKTELGLQAFPDWLIKGTLRPSSGRLTFTTWDYFKPNSPLESSRLLGPVRLMCDD